MLELELIFFDFNNTFFMILAFNVTKTNKKQMAEFFNSIFNVINFFVTKLPYQLLKHNITS